MSQNVTAPEETIQEADGSERRRQTRFPYQYRQSIAYFDGMKLPRSECYEEAELRDLSTGGFSFISRVVPPTDHVAVRLGRGRMSLTLTAAIVHCRETELNGETVYTIGCSFTGRT